MRSGCDIARMAGVSESTVSRALANNPAVAARTRALVQKIAADAGYRINPAARSLRSKRTGIVSVAVPLAHQRAQPLYDPFQMPKNGRAPSREREWQYG